MIYKLSIQYPNQIIIKLILHIKIYQYLQETERLCKISLGKWNISIRISNINNMIKFKVLPRTQLIILDDAFRLIGKSKPVNLSYHIDRYERNKIRSCSQA